MKFLKGRYVLVSMSLALAGCGVVIEHTKSVPQWTWHCETNSDTGEWDCQRVQLIDGRLPAELLRQKQIVVEVEPVPSVAEEWLDAAPESVAIEVTEPQAVLIEPLPEEPNVSQHSGFVVQLAALGKQNAIDHFVDEHQLTSDDLAQHYILSNGLHWHVLTAGQYNTRGDAVEAAEQLRQNHPELKPWVRSARSLQQAVEAAR